MKRNELKVKMQELGLEVNDDLINYVMAQNGQDIENLKNSHTNEIQNLQNELTEKNNKISEYEANTSQYADYEELKKFKEATVQKEENQRKIDYLKTIKCKHPELFVEKFDWTKAVFNEEKKTYEGLDEQVKSYKETYKDMFDFNNQQGVNPSTDENTGSTLTGVEKHFYGLNPDLRK